MAKTVVLDLALGMFYHGHMIGIMYDSFLTLFVTEKPEKLNRFSVYIQYVLTIYSINNGYFSRFYLLHGLYLLC
jgi:hypothetical protein